MSKRRRGLSSAPSPAPSPPMNDIEAARARADAAIRGAAQPLSPQDRVVEIEKRLDRWVNYATGLGTFEDKTRASSFDPPWRLSDVEITSLASANDLAAKCIEKRPDEMFRRGYAIEGQKPGTLDKSAIDELSAYATEDLLADVRMHEGMQYGRQYGGSLCILGINDGRQPDEPVDEENIQSIDFINQVDRRFAYARSWYSRMDEPGLGQVETYLVANAIATSSYRSPDGTKFGYRKRSPEQIQKWSPGSAVLTIHESRVIRFDGIVPDLLSRQTLAGWSWSVLQRPYEILRMCDGSFDALAYLISDASQGVMKLKGLFSAISGGKEQKLQQRLDTMDRMRSVMRTIALDADGQEDFTRVTTPLSGIPESIDRIMQRLAAAMDMPVTELFGISPAGLNATGESDRIKWYDTIATEQRKYLAPKLKRLYRLISLAQDGPFKGKGADFKVTFHPLYAPTDDELAKTRLANAQRDEIYVNAEVVTAQQVTLTLTDVYPSINADEIEEAIDDKVAFDPLENDENKSAEAQAEAAKPPTPVLMHPGAPAALPAKGGGAKAGPPGPGTVRGSTPAKAQANPGPPGATKAAPKKAANDAHADRWNPEQPRDEHGRWTEEEAVSASREATEHSRMAMVFGGHDDHENASRAHEHAAMIAHQLAGKHEALGNKRAAQKFHELSAHHAAMASSHALEAERLRPPPEPEATERPGIQKAGPKRDPARSLAAYKGHETRGERDEAVRVNLPAHLHPLWAETKGQFKGTPHERFEQFTHYAEEHSHEGVRAMQKSADDRLESLIEEYQSRRADALARSLELGRADGTPEQPRGEDGKWIPVGGGSSAAGGHDPGMHAEGSRIREAAPHEFKAAFDAAFKDSPFANHVSHYSEDQLKGMKTFVTEDGKAGIAVHTHPDGRVEGTGLFNQGGAKGAGVALLNHAIDHAGVNYLECYGEQLRALYERAGFEVDTTSPFDPTQASPTWDYEKFGKPNYYTLKKR